MHAGGHVHQRPDRHSAAGCAGLCCCWHAKEAAAAFPAPGGAANITKVTLVVATHLDVGYHSGGPEPGYDNNTLSRYFNTHFPRAVRVARQLRQRPGGTERLVFLTHSWLVSLFLDCPTHIGLVCPNATTVADFKAAVHRGDITWHALPHNAQVGARYAATQRCSAHSPCKPGGALHGRPGADTLPSPCRAPAQVELYDADLLRVRPLLTCTLRFDCIFTSCRLVWLRWQTPMHSASDAGHAVVAPPTHPRSLPSA